MMIGEVTDVKNSKVDKYNGMVTKNNSEDSSSIKMVDNRNVEDNSKEDEGELV